MVSSAFQSIDQIVHNRGAAKELYQSQTKMTEWNWNKWIYWIAIMIGIPFFFRIINFKLISAVHLFIEYPRVIFYLNGICNWCKLLKFQSDIHIRPLFRQFSLPSMSFISDSQIYFMELYIHNPHSIHNRHSNRLPIFTYVDFS